MNEFSKQVVLVLNDAVKAYGELAETLPGFLASEEDSRYDTDIINTYRSIAMEASRSLALVNRDIDDMRIAGLLENDTPIVLQPILRMIGESFLLLTMSRSREDILKAPLVDPLVIDRMIADPKIQTHMRRK